MKSWGYMQINLMSPLSPRKKNNPPKDAEFSGGQKQGGGGLSGTPEGVPWAGELGGDSFQAVARCMGGDTWPGLAYVPPCAVSPGGAVVLWRHAPALIQAKQNPAAECLKSPPALNTWGHIWGHKSKSKIKK
jgi:hypothetical protein